MRFTNHICTRFLKDETLIWEIVERMHPNWKSEPAEKIAGTYSLLRADGNTNYYITKTVSEKLDMLKVKKLDWTVFGNVKDRKVTFILPDNKVIRIDFFGEKIAFCYLTFTFLPNDTKKNNGNAYWVMWFVNRINGEVAEHYHHQDVQQVADYIYRLMCFFFLSENEEIIIAPGKKYGTKKSPDNLINELDVPIIIVNSKWNITSVRNEGFPVSGHFRLQPTNAGTKMIFIEPFQKHGYVRRAKNIDEV